MAEKFAKLGVWDNFSSHGTALKTLTVVTRVGLVISAFISIIIACIGTLIWEIVSPFLIRKVNRQLENNVVHQLNTYHEPLGVGHSPIKTASTAFRNLRRYNRRRVWLLATILVSIFYTGIFITLAAVGPFLVALPNSQVLLMRQACGFPDIRYQSENFRSGENLGENEVINTIDAYAIKSRNLHSWAANYVRSCYAEDSSDTLCNQMVVPRIESKTIHTVECPFADGACKTENAIQMASKMMDSNNDLGVNSNLKDRVQTQRNLTCAPLNVDRYIEKELQEALGPVQKKPETLYKFGGRLNGTNDVVQDYTFTESDIAISSNRAYQLRNFIYYKSNVTACHDHKERSECKHYHKNGRPIPQYLTESEFLPHSDFLQKSIDGQMVEIDGDISIWALASNAKFTNKTTDPLFKASKSAGPIGLLKSVQLYVPDQKIAVLGCVEQFAVCSSNHCTKPGGMYQIRNEITMRNLQLSRKQKAILDIIMDIENGSRLEWFDYLTADEVLLAKKKLYQYQSLSISSKLDDDQWKLEVQNIHNISLAILQKAVVDTVTPDSTKIDQKIIDDFRITNEDEKDNWFCDSQKIRSPSHMSFNLVALICLLGFTFMLTIVRLAFSFRRWRVQSTPHALERFVAGVVAAIRNTPLVLPRAQRTSPPLATNASSTIVGGSGSAQTGTGADSQPSSRSNGVQGPANGNNAANAPPGTASQPQAAATWPLPMRQLEQGYASGSSIQTPPTATFQQGQGGVSRGENVETQQASQQAVSSSGSSGRSDPQSLARPNAIRRQGTKYSD